MPSATVIPQFWIYRVGLYSTDYRSRRFLASETWLSETEEVSEALTAAALSTLLPRYTDPFGFGSVYGFHGCGTIMQRIWPSHHLFTTPDLTPDIFGTPLNDQAEEAALRLQRVGASGSFRPGRLPFPIVSDDFYTDLPHRRHVDVATIDGLLDAGLRTWPLSITSSGRTYTNVLYRRSTFEWEAVDHYSLLVNPIRIWQRWRVYDWPHRAASDDTYTPPNPPNPGS